MFTKFKELSLRTLPSQLESFPLPPFEIPLPNVKKLALELSELYLIAKLLHPADQNFCEIAVHLRSPELAMFIDFLFIGLAPQTHKSPPRSLHLESTSYRDHMSSIVLHDTFQPLTFLGDLQNLTIILENRISLSDEGLANLARNWPLLQVFELYRICGLSATDTDNSTTFNGLLSLVVICPNLRKIGLTLDVPTGVPVDPRSKSITVLRFPGSPINDPRLVARFLVMHFPSVTTTGEYNRPMWIWSAPHSEQCVEVDKHLAGVNELESSEA